MIPQQREHMKLNKDLTIVLSGQTLQQTIHAYKICK
jgi:hypothetical protein